MEYSAVLEDRQIALISGPGPAAVPVRHGLLKWIGNKQRYAARIVSSFPRDFGKYFEPFVGSAAVLATLQPKSAIASDTFAPLIEILQTLAGDPTLLKEWYEERWLEFNVGDPRMQYERIKERYNQAPSAGDLLFLCRTCYGGVVRFRKADGYMSTPCGAHNPIRPASFAARVDEWHQRVSGTTFLLADFRTTMRLARRGDLVYCDPPYRDTQRILYGAQGFNLEALFDEIEVCKSRGVYVALSIDGTKRSGRHTVKLPIPHGLFNRELLIHGPASMLKRFQAKGRTLHDERVSERLLLTY